MYKFKLHSVDGVSSRKYSDLDQFEKDWTEGKPSDFSGGTYVTPDGITVIYPDNDRTLQALQSRYEAHREMLANPISMLQKEIFEAAGIEPEVVTTMGRTLVDPGSNSVIISRLRAMPPVSGPVDCVEKSA